MERRISEAKRKFLSGESRKWVELGLITEGQRGGILESYTVSNSLPAAVLTLGVSMIGVGILSFIAANWQALPIWTRVAVIIGAYLASVVSAYLMETRG
ncbi:MAG: DUF2157 domain-containing protein, partial [Synergistaceae bacterium]|nr:DUF2157 domain-containing protein [Synergistaceae bacterium]